MTISRKNLLGSGIVLSIALAVGCGKATPTTPTSADNAPSIASLSPANPQPSPAAQTMAVTGTNFFTGLVFTLRAPDGSTNVYSGPSISGQTSTGFTVNVVLPLAGNWTANVKNVDGLESTNVGFAVAGTVSTGPPQIVSITPGLLFRNASVQSFSINGQNFRAGLTIVVTNPAGSEVQSFVGGQDDTSISASSTFNTVGIYTVVVRNADGGQSGAYSLTVNPAAP